MPEYRPIRVHDEDHFLELVNLLPDPITPDARKEYNRLRAMAARRGWSWPYRTHVAPSQRRMPIAPNPKGYY